MPEFFFAARESVGERFTGFVDADTEDAAYDDLEGRGLIDVYVRDTTTGPRRDETWTLGELVIGAVIIVVSGALEAGTLLFRYRAIFVPVLVVLVYRRFDASPWTIWDTAMAAVLMIAPVLGVRTAWKDQRRFIATASLIRAAAWGRWHELLALTDPATVSPDLDPVEAASRRAIALGALGRTEEAKALLDEMRRARWIPTWKKWWQLAYVHLAACHPAEAIQALRRSIRLEPDDPRPLIELAFLLNWYRRDTRTPPKLIQQVQAEFRLVRRSTILDLVQGAIDYEEGKLKSAEAGVGTYVWVSGLMRRVYPECEEWLALGWALLAEIHVALGRPETALRFARKAWPRLIARRDLDSLDRLERALDPIMFGESNATEA